MQALQSRMLALPIDERAEAIAQLESDIKAGNFNPLMPFRQSAYEQARESFFNGMGRSATVGIVGGGAVFLAMAALPAALVSALLLFGGGTMSFRRWQEAKEAIEDDDFGYLLSDRDLEELEALLGEMGEPKTPQIAAAIEAAKEIVSEELGEFSDEIDAEFEECELEGGETASKQKSGTEPEDEPAKSTPWEETTGATEANPWVFKDGEVNRVSEEYSPEWEKEHGKLCVDAGITLREYTRYIEFLPLDVRVPTPAEVAAIMRDDNDASPVSPAPSPESSPTSTCDPVSSDVSETFDNFKANDSIGLSGDDPKDFEDVSERTLKEAKALDEAEVSAFLVSDVEKRSVTDVIMAFAPYEPDRDNSDVVFAAKEALRIGRSETWIRTELFDGISPGGSKKYQEFKAVIHAAKEWL